MLIDMTEIRPGEDTSSGRLPTGTVTLLLAKSAETTRLWQTQPEEAAAVKLVAAHDGVRPARQSDGDPFVAAFTRPSDAVACALDLQRLALNRWRIAIHTGELQLGENAGYTGPTVNCAARLRDLTHAGQTVLSGLTGKLVADRLPANVWLTDLGSHPLRGVPRPQHVVQLCHPDSDNVFPPLRISDARAGGHPPVPLTSFVGRQAELTEVRDLVRDHRLVTLTGAGGVGKTRLAAQLVEQLTDEFNDEMWWLDLASVTDSNLVAISLARTLRLPDQPGRSTMETLIRFIKNGRMLLVLDNCEHLLEACATLTAALLAEAERLTIVATSREPIRITGEVVWPTPSLSLADDAVALFTDRARLARPGFAVTADNAETLSEICRRLDGVPLAIELAAARVRAMSLAEIADGLHDRFRLLTGGARTAVERQQTLRASMDWSHALLTEPDRVLFRRLAVFLGGFDLTAAHAVAGDAGLTRDQTLDELSLLVNKSLVVAEGAVPATRYRLLEMMRHYALDKLAKAGEGDTVRTRHRDHYIAVFGTAPVSVQQLVERAQAEMDNLRAAFAWSRERGDIDAAARLASSLQPLWLARGRILEGLTWFGAVLTESAAMAPAVRARTLADKLVLDHSAGIFDSLDQADQALAIARSLDDPDLSARVLTACGVACIFCPEAALGYFAEASELASALGDDWQLSWISAWQANAAYQTGDPTATRIAAERGRDLADAIGEGVLSRMCRWLLGQAQWLNGDLASAAAQFSDVITRAQAAQDPMWRVYSLFMLARTLAYQGDTRRAHAAAEQAIEAAADITGIQRALTFGARAYVALATGDAATATEASDTAWQACPQLVLLAVNAVPIGQAALAAGDVRAAFRWTDDAVSAAKGAHRMLLQVVRARVAIAQGDVDRADREARHALSIAADASAYLTIPDAIECLAVPAVDSGSHRQAARLFGAAAAIRDRTGQVRFKVYDTEYAAAVDALRSMLGDNGFDAAWAEGSALSTEEAIDSALRESSPRKRPPSGWESLTPTERDVVRLVAEGLANKDIAARLFVSPRTVQTHLTHIYAKLGMTTRVQLARQAAHRS